MGKVYVQTFGTASPCRWVSIVMPMNMTAKTSVPTRRDQRRDHQPGRDAPSFMNCARHGIRRHGAPSVKQSRSGGNSLHCMDCAVRIRPEFVRSLRNCCISHTRGVRFRTRAGSPAAASNAGSPDSRDGFPTPKAYPRPSARSGGRRTRPRCSTRIRDRVSGLMGRRLLLVDIDLLTALLVKLDAR